MTFQDVTTRGSYFPNKSMATAAVSFLTISSTLLWTFSPNDLE